MRYFIARIKPKKSGDEHVGMMKQGFFDTAEEAQEWLDGLADDRGWQWCGEGKEVKENVGF